MSAPTTISAPIGIGVSAIRLGITLLGVTAFALSYAALRQMAVATHVPGPLTYAFPLVIDGFIAIGIGALLLMRTAPLRARLYVWALVGLATLTSIWANALHAIRLNQQILHDGLRLDDVTVGVLSAIAPLALAGAVHFYFVTRHHQAQHEPTFALTEQAEAPTPVSLSGGDGMAESPLATLADVPEPVVKPKGRRPAASEEQLLAIGRTVPRGPDGLIPRKRFEAAVRKEGYPVGKDRLVMAMDILHADFDDTTD
ncbi:DUF2637 domain-containing protein [Streptomyces sp. ISL-43]|uniref:DUF2637 domain-containing protein n=1 Tax=Streptomyces sp. ISL-43 TaxID=2819183 RepID=UPI002035E8E9|nr:DUF2637 domain-containing protein [Streptomyces sp. ISL-43]